MSPTPGKVIKIPLLPETFLWRGRLVCYKSTTIIFIKWTDRRCSVRRKCSVWRVILLTHLSYIFDRLWRDQTVDLVLIGESNWKIQHNRDGTSRECSFGYLKCIVFIAAALSLQREQRQIVSLVKVTEKRPQKSHTPPKWSSLPTNREHVQNNLHGLHLPSPTTTKWARSTVETDARQLCQIDPVPFIYDCWAIIHGLNLHLRAYQLERSSIWSPLIYWCKCKGGTKWSNNGTTRSFICSLEICNKQLINRASRRCQQKQLLKFLFHNCHV
jgi:hypothetical protein